jgi:transcriptional regulator with PAS, ATPase and Fis domain
LQQGLSHYNSPRRTKPFTAINCAAIPENLIESELFGYEPGAFTGATSRGIGLFEATNGGTIFLDEVGDLPALTQSKILRVLQDKEIRRLGSRENIRIDVRIIAATNRDLEKEIGKELQRRSLLQTESHYHRASASAEERRHTGTGDLFIKNITKNSAKG